MPHLYARCNIFYGFYIIFAAVSNNAKFDISFIGCNKKGKLVASFNRLQPLQVFAYQKEKKKYLYKAITNLFCLQQKLGVTIKYGIHFQIQQVLMVY